MNGLPVIFILLHGQWLVSLHSSHSYDYNTKILKHNLYTKPFCLQTKNLKKSCFGCAGLVLNSVKQHVRMRYSDLSECTSIYLYLTSTCVMDRVEIRLNKQKPVMMYCTFLKGVKALTISTRLDKGDIHCKNFYQLAHLVLAFIPEKNFF